VASAALPPLDHVRAFLLERREVALQRAQLYTTLNEQIDRAGIASPGGLLLLQGLVSPPERQRGSSRGFEDGSEMVPGVEHYASGLEGCGIALENDVRAAYYTFIRTLLLRAPLPAPGGSWWDTEAHDYVLHGNACVYVLILSMLSVKWQPCDFGFLADASVPSFVLAAAAISAREVRLVPTSDTEDIAALQQIHLLARAVLGGLVLSLAGWKAGPTGSIAYGSVASAATAESAVAVCRVLLRVTWAPEFSTFLLGLLASIVRASTARTVHCAVARHAVLLCLTWHIADSFPTLVSVLGQALLELPPTQADLMVAEGFQLAIEHTSAGSNGSSSSSSLNASAAATAPASDVTQRRRPSWGDGKRTSVKAIHPPENAPVKHLLATPNQGEQKGAGKTTVDFVLTIALCETNRHNASIAGAAAGVLQGFLDHPAWRAAASEAFTEVVLGCPGEAVTVGCAFVLEVLGGFPVALIPGAEVDVASASVSHTRGRLLSSCWKQGTATVGYDNGNIVHVPVHHLDFAAAEDRQGARCVATLPLQCVFPRLSSLARGGDGSGAALKHSAFNILRCFLQQGSPADRAIIVSDAKLMQAIVTAGSATSTGLDSHWMRRELALAGRLTRGDTWRHPYLQADGTAGVSYFNCSSTFRLRVRRQPNTASMVVAHLRPGEAAIAIDKEGFWLRLQLQPGWGSGGGVDGGSPAAQAWALSCADDRDGITHVMLQRSETNDTAARLLPEQVTPQPSLVLGARAAAAPPTAQAAADDGLGGGDFLDAVRPPPGGDDTTTIKQLSKAVLGSVVDTMPCSLVTLVPYALLAGTGLVSRPRMQVQSAHPVPLG